MSFWDEFKKAPPSVTKDVTMPEGAWEKIKGFADVAAKIQLSNGDYVVSVPREVEISYLRRIAGSDSIHEVIDVEGWDVT